MLSSDDHVFDTGLPKGAKFDPSHWFVTDSLAFFQTDISLSHGTLLALILHFLFRNLLKLILSISGVRNWKCITLLPHNI